MPRKLRELLKDYVRAGADIDKSAGKGSHRKIKHANYMGMVIVSGKPGDDVKKYQEKISKTFLMQFLKTKRMIRQ